MCFLLVLAAVHQAVAQAHQVVVLVHQAVAQAHPAAHQAVAQAHQAVALVQVALAHPVAQVQVLVLGIFTFLKESITSQLGKEICLARFRPDLKLRLEVWVSFQTCSMVLVKIMANFIAKLKPSLPS